MIWLIMGAFVLAVLLYVARPLYVKNVPVAVKDSEVTDYLGQIADIDSRIKNADKSVDVPALEIAKVELQRQVLAKDTASKDAGPQALLINTLFIIFAFTAMGLYATLGRPDLTKAKNLVQNAGLQAESDMSLEQAIAQLELKLAQGDQSPQGWILYARSLMSMQRYDDAVTAYEKVLVLTNNNPQVQEEFESAKTYIAEKKAEIGSIAPDSIAPGPSAEQIQAAAAMTPKARQDMIKGMLDGLSQKLKDNPKDPEGWMRLLKARKVLGQEAEALADIVLLRETYKDNPAVARKILSDTGWLED